MIAWGTYFLRKKNVVRRTGTCTRCGNPAQLTDFDGYLFFHVQLIPLIPLGAFHVRDHCQRCQQQLPVPRKEWEERKQAARATLAEGYQRDPNNVVDALEALRLTTQFFGPDEAEAVADDIRRRHAKHEEAMAAVKRWYTEHGRAKDAVAMRGSQGSSAGRADDAELRQLGHAFLQERKPAEAARHFLQIRQPQAGDFILVVRAADGLYRAGQRDEAYEAFTYLFQHFPERASRHHQVLTRVRKLEKTRGMGPSIIPPGVNVHRNEIIVGALLTVALAGALAFNYWVSQNQILYLTNPFETPATVDTGTVLYTLPPHQIKRVIVPEGGYTITATLDNGYTAQTTADIHTNFFLRFEQRPVYVYNPLGGDVFVFEEIAYSTSGNVPGSTDIYLGQDLYRFTGIEFPFTRIPDKVDLNDWGTTKRLQAIYRLPHKSPPTVIREGLAFLEENPGDAPALLIYAFAHAVAGNRDPRFLEQLNALCANQGVEDQCEELVGNAEADLVQSE